MGDVIVTVHGTNAGRPEDDGDGWWQRGSTFQKRLCQLVTSADGSPLEFRPFHWSGRNSETDRRKAGRQLARNLREIEKEGRRYHVIGHSHGGSVAYFALIADHVASGGGLLAAARLLVRRGNAPSPRRALPSLQSWTSVGAPFVVTQRSLNILARFNVWGQCALLLIVAYSYGIARYIYAYGLDSDFAVTGEVLPPLLLLGLMIWGLASASRYSRAITSAGTRLAVARQFEARAPLLRHQQDEAISGLASSLRIAPKLFASFQFARIATNVALLIATLLAGGVFVALSGNSPTLYQIFRRYDGPTYRLLHSDCQSFDCVRDLSWWEYPIALITLIYHVFGQLNNVATGFLQDHHAPWQIWKFCSGFIEWIFPAGVLLVISILSQYTFPIFASPMALLLNSVSGRNLKNSVFGNDVPGEWLAALTPAPPAFSGAWGPLPAPVGEAIENYTEQFALETLRRTRKLLGAASIANGPLDVSKLTGESISWHELIHTSYFDVDEFIRLLAVGLVEAGGLKPSEAFRASPDFEEARGWLHIMRIPQAGKHASDAGNKMQT